MAGVAVMAGVSVGVGASVSVPKGDAIAVGTSVSVDVAARVGVWVSGKRVVVKSSGVWLGGDVSVGATWMVTFENMSQAKIVRLRSTRKGVIFFIVRSTP